MAIEKVEIQTGTPGASVAADQRHAVWEEGRDYLVSLKNLLEKTALFSGFRYELPDEPTASSYTGYSDGSNYKLWCSVGVNEDAEEIFGIGPYSFTAYNPTQGTFTYAVGARIYVKYANGEYTVNEQQAIGGAGHARANIDLAYVTSNGVLMRNILQRSTSSNPNSNPTVVVPIMIAKSNGKYPMIMAGGLGSNMQASYLDDNGQKAHNQAIIANYSDQQYFRTYRSGQTGYSAKQTFPFMTSAKQSELVPFAGYGKAEEYTYTAKGFWIPVASSTVRGGGLHKVHINGKNFVTDGYWALQDG